MFGARHAQAPIILSGANNPSEEEGPFDSTFQVDDQLGFNMVIEIFQAYNAVWTHVKSTRKKLSAWKMIPQYHSHFLSAN